MHDERFFFACVIFSLFRAVATGRGTSQAHAGSRGRSRSGRTAPRRARLTL